MNVNISVFLSYVDAIILLLLYNVHDYTFVSCTSCFTRRFARWQVSKTCRGIFLILCRYFFWLITLLERENFGTIKSPKAFFRKKRKMQMRGKIQMQSQMQKH